MASFPRSLKAPQSRAHPWILELSEAGGDDKKPVVLEEIQFINRLNGKKTQIHSHIEE